VSQATSPSLRPSRSSILLYAIALLALLAATAGGAAAAAMRAKPQEVRAKASGPAPRLAASAQAQINVLREIKINRTAVQGKIGSRLFLGILKLNNDARTQALPTAPGARADNRAENRADDDDPADESVPGQRGARPSNGGPGVASNGERPAPVARPARLAAADGR